MGRATAQAQPLNLVATMDEATSELYSAFLVEEGGAASTFRVLLEVFARHGLPLNLYTDRGSHYFHTAKAGGKVDRSQPTQVGPRAVASRRRTILRPIRRRRVAERSACSLPRSCHRGRQGPGSV